MLLQPKSLEFRGLIPRLDGIGEVQNFAVITLSQLS
jgi:hypothetical protein